MVGDEHQTLPGTIPNKLPAFYDSPLPEQGLENMVRYGCVPSTILGHTSGSLSLNVRVPQPLFLQDFLDCLCGFYVVLPELTDIQETLYHSPRSWICFPGSIWSNILES